MESRERKKRIAMSGAGGFIGTFLSDYFREEGYDIIPLSRKLFIPEAEAELIHRIASADIVINLAGAPILHRWTSSYKRQLLDSRIKTTHRLVKAMQQTGVQTKLFISTSAVGYYKMGEKVDEYTGHPGNTFLARVCQEWEAEALQASPQIRTAITRFGVIFAPHGGAFSKMALPAKCKFPTVFGTGDQALPWMSLVDLARAMTFLVENEHLSGVFNFTTPHPITYTDFARSLGEKYHAFFRIHLPLWMIRLVLGEATGFITDNAFVIPTRLQEEGFIYLHPGLADFLSSF